MYVYVKIITRNHSFDLLLPIFNSEEIIKEKVNDMY